MGGGRGSSGVTGASSWAGHTSWPRRLPPHQDGRGQASPLPVGARGCCLASVAAAVGGKGREEDEEEDEGSHGAPLAPSAVAIAITPVTLLATWRRRKREGGE